MRDVARTVVCLSLIVALEASIIAAAIAPCCCAKDGQPCRCSATWTVSKDSGCACCKSKRDRSESRCGDDHGRQGTGCRCALRISLFAAGRSASKPERKANDKLQGHLTQRAFDPVRLLKAQPPYHPPGLKRSTQPTVMVLFCTWLK